MRSLILILAAGAVTAAAPEQPSGKPAPQAQPDDQKQICRRETPIGTIRTIKVCMTKKEW